MQEPKTIKTVASSIGITDAAVMRTLKRWVNHSEKSKLFSNQQKSFINSIKKETEWPEWLNAIWCDNYQPRAKQDEDKKVVTMQQQSKPPANVLKVLDDTEAVFAEAPAEVVDFKSLANFQADEVKSKDSRIEELELEVSSLEERIKLVDAQLDIAVRQYYAESEESKAANKEVGDLAAELIELQEKLKAYEAKTIKKRIIEAIQYAFSDYLIPKVVLLAFQSYIYAMYTMRVFAFLNTRMASRDDISDLYTNTILHEPWFVGMWVLGFFVDGAGFAIAAKLSEPKYLSDGDVRMTWISWFFVLQIAIDLCYLFGTFHPVVEWFGAVIIVIAPALGIMAYARATFKKGKA